jgi:very-short-patch-repair endonuclease
MELMIINHLISNNIKFIREVEFDKCVNPKTKQKLRFDFYIPSLNCLLEYDGLKYHSSKDQIYRDSIKNRFAKNNGFILIRIQGSAKIEILSSLMINLNKKVLESNNTISYIFHQIK